eukprot:10161779-Alexandrium_andersonii.AAC.1
MSASSIATPRSEAPARAHLRHQARVAERRSACPQRATIGARGTRVPATGNSPPCEGEPELWTLAPHS